MSKKNKQVYKRKHIISLSKGGSTTSFTMKPSGEITLKDENGNPAKDFLLSQGLSYIGQANSPKIVAEIYETKRTDTSLFSSDGYDNVYVCDTNTIKNVYGERNLSVTAVSEVLKEKSSEEINNGYILYTHFLIFWLWEGDYNIELYAWEEAMRIITQRYRPGNNCLFIVDSEWGTLQEYNEGTSNFPSGRRLPVRFKLAYASSDRSGSYMNAAIRKCDMVSRTILHDMKETLLQAFKEMNLPDPNKRLCIYGRLVNDGSKERIEYFNKWIGLY